MALNISDALSQNVVDKRIDVLQRIKQYGSISEAARSAGISYKAAWQAIETLSALAGEPLVEKTVGGNSGGGARITEAGEAVLEASAALNKVRNQILTDIQGGESPKLAALASVALRMSIRNIIPCVIEDIHGGMSMCKVKMKVCEGQYLRSSVTYVHPDGRKTTMTNTNKLVKFYQGYAAAGKLQNMVNTIFIAFGATIATYVGQNRGAGRLDRVRQGVKDTQIMILIAAAAFFLIIHFLAGKLTLIFVDSSKTVVIDAANQYFKTVSWCYPFLGSIFLYRNALQGMGYGLVPMLGGVFELMARAGVVALVLHLGGGFVQTCLSDPAAWISALIPLIPYYFYKMRQYSLQESKKVL